MIMFECHKTENKITAGSHCIQSIGYTKMHYTANTLY